MRLLSVRTGLPIALAAAGTAAYILWPALSPRAQRSSQATTEPNAMPEGSPVFTPAHRTALDAMRDFFNRHSEPVQPMAFTHKAHLANGMQCTNCHAGVDTGPDAAIPGVKFCMMC